MARLDRVLRGVALVPVFALCATLAIVLIAWGLLYTKYGQEQLRELAEERLDGALGDGRAVIGSASFDLSGEVVLRDIRVTLDGRDVVTVGELRVEVEPFSFLGGDVRIPSIVAIDPYVDARADLSRLAPPAEPDEEEGAGGLGVALDLIQVRGGTLRLPEATIENAELDANVDLATRSVAVHRARARWAERDRTASAEGWVREIDGTWVTAEARAEVGGVVVEVERGSFEPESGAVAAMGRVEATAADALALGGEWLPADADRWRGDLDIGFTALRERTGDAWELSAAGAVGSAQVAARARADGADVRGRARLDAVRPQALYEGAPSGALDAKLAVGDGEVKLLARGQLEGIEAKRFEATARGDLDGGFIEADLTDRRGVIHAEVRAERRNDGALVIRESHLHGDVSDVIARFDTPPVRSLEVDLHAVGPTTDLLVSGEADVVGLRQGSTRIGRAHARLRVPHVSVEESDPRLAGTLAVSARNVDVSGRRVGWARASGSFADNAAHLDLSVEARQLEFADVARGEVVVDRRGNRTEIAMGEVVVETGELSWTGEGGRITVDESGRMEFDDVDLSSPAGSLHVHGVLDAPRTRRKEGRLTVELAGLDLRAAAPAFAVAGIDHPLEGRVDANIALARRGRTFEVDGRADYRDVVWRPGAAAANGFVSASLGGGTVSAQIEVTPRDHHGRIALDVEAAAPRDTLDEGSWRRLDLDDIRRAELTLEEIDGHVVEAFAGAETPVSGMIAGTISFPHDGRHAFGIDLTVSGVATPWVDRLGGTLVAVWDDRELSGRADVTQAGLPVIGGSIAVDRGFQELWRKPLADFATARVAVDASIRDFDLRRLTRVGVVRESIAGTLDADLTVSGSIERPKVVLKQGRASNVVVAGVGVPQVTLTGTWEGKNVAMTARAQQSAGGSIKVDGGLDWQVEPRIAGTITASSFDLKPLRAFSERDTDELAQLEGALDAELRVSGPIDRPRIHGTASARRVGLLLESGTRRIRDGLLRVRFEGDRAEIEKLTARSGEGRASATGTVLFDDRSFELDVETDDLPVVIASYVASVDAQGGYAGRWVDGGLDTRAEIRGGTVRLADTRELQSLGALEDVVYVERVGGSRREGAGPTVADAMPISVRIVTLEPVRVKSPEIDATVNADLTIRYRGVLTYMKGYVEVERGNFRLFERSYQIAVASATFDGPVPIDPSLDIELRRSFPSAIVSIFVTDQLSDPRIQFRSDNPDYNDEQILAIILGQDPEEQDTSTRTPAQQAGGAAANVIVGKVVRDTLGLPIDIVRTHPDGYEIGKYFFDGTVLVGYRSRDTDEIDENRNEGTIEWRLRRNIVLEGSYGDSNVGAADILYIIRF